MSWACLIRLNPLVIREELQRLVSCEDTEDCLSLNPLVIREELQRLFAATSPITHRLNPLVIREELQRRKPCKGGRKSSS